MPSGPAVAQGAASESPDDCTSGESKAAKRPRRAANAARELVQDIVANDSDSEAADDPPVRAKAAKKTAAATPGGSGPRPKLPRPEGIACCPRCKSEDTKFCYYNNYNIKQPRFFCKGCQRYWTDGGMLRNVPVGSGRRKNKNSVAREAEKAATADAAKQQNMIAAGAYEQFRHLLMDPSLAFSVGAPLPAGGAAPGAGPAAVGPDPGPLPPPAPMGAFPMFPTLGSAGPSTEYDGPAALRAADRVGSASPDDGGPSRPTSDAVHALLGGPTSAGPPSSAGILRGSLPSMEGKPILSLRPGASLAAAAAEAPALTQAASQAPVSQQAPALSSQHPFGRLMGASNSLLSNSTPSEWANMAAAGQMQAAAVAARQQQQQLQQAAALQAQAHLQAAAANFGQQQQNPYLNSMWPYNMYPTGANWAAAAYARLGQQQSWQAAEPGGSLQSLSGASAGNGLLSASEAMAAGGVPPALMAGVGGGPPPPAAMLGAPMWSQQWSAPGASGGWGGPMGGVPVNSAAPQLEKPMFGNNGSILSGGSNNSTVTLLGHKVTQPRPQ